MPFVLASPAFAEGDAIPVRHTCDGENISPELAWSGAPPGTRSFALVMHDPDGTRGDFVHWLLWDIGADESSLAEGVGGMSTGASGENGFRDISYAGPCPPPGSEPHRYFFELYALDVERLGVDRGTKRAEAEMVMRQHQLGQTKLMGRYARQKK